MPQIEVPFANQEGQSAVAQNGRETLINMFAEIETSGRRKLIRRQRMCLEMVYAVTGEKRVIEKNGTNHYLVIGNKFYTFDGTTLTERGTLDTSTGPCTMIFDDNGDVLLSDGETAYHWDGATFTEPDTQGDAGTLTFINGYAVTHEPDTGRFKWSAVNDMQAWDGLDFATAEGKPDVLVRVFEDHTQLFLFGTETIEVWTLTGSTDSAFSYYTAMERGCGAALSVVGEDNTLFWLGDDWIVYRADGYRPARVSNHSVERMIQDLDEDVRATCIAFTYADQGHKFITLSWPGYLSLQYNIATGFWNVARTLEEDDWQVVGPQFTKTDYVLTPAGISRLRRGINKDNTIAVERGGISPPLSDGARRVAMQSFFLDAEVGHAATAPNITLRISRDGETFGTERVRTLGAPGAYSHRAMWRGCGIGRRMMLEILTSDDFEFTILGADAEGEILA